MRVHNALWLACSARREHDKERMIKRKLLVCSAHILELREALKIVQRYPVFFLESTITPFFTLPVSYVRQVLLCQLLGKVWNDNGFLQRR